MNTKQIGIITEQKVISKFLELGYTVATVIGDNSPYDIIVDKQDILYRVQIKTGRLRNGCVVFNTQSCRINMNKVYITNYINKIDIFVVWCRDIDAYFSIPVECAAKSSMCIRVFEPKNGRYIGINNYEDFILK